MKKLLNLGFIVLFMLLLLGGLFRTVFLPTPINEYENRIANKLDCPTVARILNREFQGVVEDALNDQIPLAISVKKTYNTANKTLLNNILTRIFDKRDIRYIDYAGMWRIDDYLVYGNRDKEKMQLALDPKIEHYNKVFKDFPNVDFQIYYIEKDTDINFTNSEKIEAYEYLVENLEIASDHIDRFEINNFDSFKEYFFKTDHHWNSKGAYKAYHQLSQRLVGHTSIQLSGERVVNNKYSGSKGRAIGAQDVFYETFIANVYSFPEMTITIDGIAKEDYGMQQIETIDTESNLGYGAYFGGDNAEIIFDTNNDEKDDILIIGESYDNAILKLLATEYNKTYSIDLRSYESAMGKPFNFNSYLEEHHLEKVLLIGNIDYFTMERFNLDY